VSRDTPPPHTIAKIAPCDTHDDGKLHLRRPIPPLFLLLPSGPQYKDLPSSWDICARPRPSQFVDSVGWRRSKLGFLRFIPFTSIRFFQRPPTQPPHLPLVVVTPPPSSKGLVNTFISESQQGLSFCPFGPSPTTHPTLKLFENVSLPSPTVPDQRLTLIPRVSLSLVQFHSYGYVRNSDFF